MIKGWMEMSLRIYILYIDEIIVRYKHAVWLKVVRNCLATELKEFNVMLSIDQGKENKF